MEKQFNYDDLPVVRIKAGKLRGYQSGGTYIFKGIPYATAKRFHMPEELEPWEGVKTAASYGFVCPTMQKENPNEELLVPHRFWTIWRRYENQCADQLCKDGQSTPPANSGMAVCEKR